MVFRTKAALNPNGVRAPTPPPQNKRKRGSPAVPKHESEERPSDILVTGSPTITETAVETLQVTQEQELSTTSSNLNQLSPDEALDRLKVVENPRAPEQTKGAGSAPQDTTQMHYCPECYLPIHPDPKPERLYIFLHALRYTTNLGSFETEMPAWATKGWVWDRS